MTTAASPLDLAAQQLAQSADYRLLRRIPPLGDWVLSKPVGEVVRACVVDTETTGLADDDEPIELAVLPFDYCKVTGRIAAVHPDTAVSALFEASRPIPEEATKVHGISQADVVGKRLDVEAVRKATDMVVIAIAHHADFDRPMCEKSWGGWDRLAWACSCNEIDWRGEGNASRSLEFLLYRMGWFYEAHRAMDDATALLWLLNQQLGERTVLAALLDSARRPQYSVRVQGSLFDEKDLLKARGYGWDKASRTWAKTVNDAVAEQAWLKSTLTLGNSSRVDVELVPPTLRYSRRAP